MPFSFFSTPARTPAFLALMSGIDTALASPVDGDQRVNAAVILGLLGAWAVLIGLKNLRELRYRPLQPAPLKRADRAARKEELPGNDKV